MNRAEVERIVASYKSHLCTECMYQSGCNRSLSPVVDPETEVVSLVCAYYGRRLQDETFGEVLARAYN